MAWATPLRARTTTGTLVFTEAEWGGDWGVRKAGAETSSARSCARSAHRRGEAFTRVQALPSEYIITPEDLQGALARQGTELQFGDVVLIRTGTLRYWGEAGEDQDKIGEHDTAGIQMPAAPFNSSKKRAR